MGAMRKPEAVTAIARTRTPKRPYSETFEPARQARRDMDCPFRVVSQEVANPKGATCEQASVEQAAGLWVD